MKFVSCFNTEDNAGRSIEKESGVRNGDIGISEGYKFDTEKRSGVTGAALCIAAMLSSDNKDVTGEGGNTQCCKTFVFADNSAVGECFSGTMDTLKSNVQSVERIANKQ